MSQDSKVHPYDQLPTQEKDQRVQEEDGQNNQNGPRLSHKQNPIECAQDATQSEFIDAETRVWSKFESKSTNEEKNNALVLNVYSGMVFCRRIARFILSFLVLGLLIGIFIWAHEVTLAVGEWESSKSYDNIFLRSHNCLINITNSTGNVKFDFITKGEFLKQNSDNQVISTSEMNDGSLELSFINPYTSLTYCYIDLQLPITLKSLEILCLHSSHCVITSHMKSLFATSLLNITSEAEGYMEINFNNLQTSSFNLKSTSSGTFIFNQMFATTARIDLIAGELIVQSSQDFTIDLTSDEHAFCTSAPFISSDLSDCYINDSTKGNKENKLKCTGKVDFCGFEACQIAQSYKISLLSATIYANRLKSQGKPYLHDREPVTILKSGQFNLPIQFNDETMIKFTDFLNQTISDADIALRIDVGGSLYLQQAANTYWAYFSNPSYASFKPWWVSIFSATFLNPQFKHFTASLNPGFCPWYATSPTIGQLYELQQYMNQFFNKTYGRTIYLSKDNRKLPGEALNEEDTYFGTEILPSKQKNRKEDWYTIQKTANIFGFQPLAFDPYFIAVIMVSVSSSILFGIMAIYLLVKLLEKIEEYILQANSQFLFYCATIQKGGQLDLNESAKAMINKLDLTGTEKDPPLLQSIFTYFWYMVAQSITKDSTKLFCDTFFKISNPRQTQDYYNNCLDEKYLRIDQWKFKEMYERFCFFNQLKIDQIDQCESLLEKYQFQLTEKNNSALLSKLKLKPKLKPYKLLCEKEKIYEDSLELFMATQVILTGVASDIVESSVLEEQYSDFCGDAIKKEKFELKNLEIKYCLAISEIKALEIRKSEFSIQEESKNIFATLLEVFSTKIWGYQKHSEPPIYILNVDSEIFNFIINPIKSINQELSIRHNFGKFSGPRMFLESLRFNFLQRIFNRVYNYDGESKNVIVDSFDLLYMRGWLTTDALIVSGNMAVMVISLLPVAFFLLVFITSYSPFSVYNPKELLFDNDLLVRPLSVFYNQYQVDQWAIVGAAIIFAYSAIVIGSQSLQYLISQFPEERSFLVEFKLFQHRLMKWFNKFQYYQFLLLMFIVFAYFGLVIVWLILGAIINPTNYLVYSSSALTLVTTISAEYSAMSELYEQACNQVQALITEQYLRTFGSMANDLIKETWRILENTIVFMNSSKMSEAKKMAGWFGIGKEMNEACLLAQNMLEKNTTETMEMDKQNLIDHRDNLKQHAYQEFWKTVSEKYKSIPVNFGECLIKSIFFPFKEIIDPLAEQAQVLSSGRIPAQIVKWFYKTIDILNLINSDPKSNQIQDLLGQKIIYPLIDALINGYLLNHFQSEKYMMESKFQDHLQQITGSIYGIIKYSSPLKQLEKIKQQFFYSENKDSEKSIEILEKVFQFYEAIKLPNSNFEFQLQILFEKFFKILGIDSNLSVVLRFFLGQRQFIEDQKYLTSGAIAKRFAQVAQTLKSPLSLSDLEFRYLVAVKYAKNEYLEIDEIFENLTTSKDDLFTNFLGCHYTWVSLAISVFTLSAKDWKSLLQIQGKGTRTKQLKEVLLLGTKSLWSSRYLDVYNELPQNLSRDPTSDYIPKTLESEKFPDRTSLLLRSGLIKRIAFKFGLEQESTVGLILLLRGEDLDSPFFLSFCESIQKYVDPIQRYSSDIIAQVLRLYLCRDFSLLKEMIAHGCALTPYSTIKRAFQHLTRLSPQNESIFERKSNVNPPVDPAQGFENTKAYDNKQKQYDSNINIRLVNYYKSGKENFFTYLKKFEGNNDIQEKNEDYDQDLDSDDDEKEVQDGDAVDYDFKEFNEQGAQFQKEDREIKAKRMMLAAIKLHFSLRHKYLTKLVELEQQIYSGQKIDQKFYQFTFLKQEPFQNLLKIISFKDPVEICNGLRYFLDTCPIDLIDQIPTIQNELEVFIEVERHLNSIVISRILPYQFYKLIPTIVNQLFGTRIPIPFSLYNDCLDLLPSHSLQDQGIVRNFVTILFQKSNSYRREAVLNYLNLSEELINMDFACNYATALVEKNYGWLMQSLVEKKSFDQKSEQDHFFRSIFIILQGLTTVNNTDQSSFSNSGQKNLIWACQQLKYFLYNQEGYFEDFALSYLKQKSESLVQADVVTALVSLSNAKLDVKLLSSLFSIEEESLIMAKFLVDAMASKKKSEWLKMPDVQDFIKKRLQIQNLGVIHEFCDLLEQNQPVPWLINWLELDQDPKLKELFSTFVYFKMPLISRGTWVENVARYNYFVKRRQRAWIYNYDVTELLLWFSSPRPTTFFYQNNSFVTGNVSYMFAAIAAFAKYDVLDRYTLRQPEFIKYRADQLATISAISHQQALHYIYESCQQDLTEAFLMLQLATGINPMLIGGFMGIKSWQDELFLTTNAKNKDLILQTFQTFLDNSSLDIYNRLYIIEYEFANMATKFKFQDVCMLKSIVEKAQENVAKLLFPEGNANSLDIITSFISENSKGYLQKHFPLSTLILINSLKNLRNFKQLKGKKKKIIKFFNSIHLIDMILTVYERYSYFFDPKSLQMINKPVLTRILSFGLFDSHEFRIGSWNQQTLENLIYPAISDKYLQKKKNIKVSLLDVVEEYRDVSDLALHYYQQLPNYSQVFVAIETEKYSEQQQRYRDYRDKWHTLFTYSSGVEGQLYLKFMGKFQLTSQTKSNFKQYYLEFFKDLKKPRNEKYGTPQDEVQVTQLMRLESTEYLDTRFLRTIYIEKAFILLKNKFDIIYVPTKKQNLIVNLLNYYGGLNKEEKPVDQDLGSKSNKNMQFFSQLLNIQNQQQSQSEPDLVKKENAQSSQLTFNPNNDPESSELTFKPGNDPEASELPSQTKDDPLQLEVTFQPRDDPQYQELPFQQENNNPTYDLFLLRKKFQQSYNEITFNKSPIKKQQLIANILQLKMRQQSISAKFLIRLLFDPCQLKYENFKFLFSEDSSIFIIILMMIRRQQENSRKEGIFSQLASNIPACMLYFQLGDQYEDTQNRAFFDENKQKLIQGIEKLIVNCEKIDEINRVPIKLLIGCYLGDIWAWLDLISSLIFDEKQQPSPTAQAQQHKTRIFIFELLQFLKRQVMKNQKLSQKQVNSQSLYQILNASQDFNLKVTVENILNVQQLKDFSEYSIEVIRYLDFVFNSNIQDFDGSVLLFIRKSYDLPDQEPKLEHFSLLLQMIQNANYFNENILLQRKNLAQKDDYDFQYIKYMIEAYNSSEFLICVKQLIMFNKIFKNKQLNRYINTLVGLCIFIDIKNLKNLSIQFSRTQGNFQKQKQEEKTGEAGKDVKDGKVGKEDEEEDEVKKFISSMLPSFLMAPVFWVFSLSGYSQGSIPYQNFENQIREDGLDFCSKHLVKLDNFDSLQQGEQILDIILNTRNQDEKDARVLNSIKIYDFFHFLRSWIHDSKAPEFFSTIIFNDNRFNLEEEIAIGDSIRALFFQTFDYQVEMDQFKQRVITYVLKDDEELSISFTALFKLIEGQYRSVASIYTDDFLCDMTCLFNNNQICQKLQNDYVWQERELIQKLNSTVSCFLNQDAYLNDPKILIDLKDNKAQQDLIYKHCEYISQIQDKICEIVEAVVQLAQDLEETQEANEGQFIETINSVLLLMYKPENSLDDLKFLKNFIQAFTAIKHKKYKEIDLGFFQLLNLNRQNSQLLVQQMGDFDKTLRFPIKMIQQKLELVNNPMVLRQIQTMNEINQKLNENKELQIEDMYKVLNKNGDRFVFAPMVLEFLRRINLNITDHKFMEILVHIKQEQVSNVENCVIDAEEFKEIMEEISIQTMELTLQFLNISKGLLAKSLMMLTIYLILVIAFILIGVQAFAIPGTFASLVNSILPMIGGISLSRASSQERSNALKIDRIKEIVKKAVRILQTTRI